MPLSSVLGTPLILVRLFFNPEIYDSPLVVVFGLLFGGVIFAAGWWLRKGQRVLACAAWFAGSCVVWVNVKIILALLLETPGPDFYAAMQRNLWMSLVLAVALLVIAFWVRRQSEHDGHEAAFMVLIGGAAASLYTALYCNTHMDPSTYLWQYIGPAGHYTVGPALRLVLLFVVLFCLAGGLARYARRYRWEAVEDRINNAGPALSREQRDPSAPGLVSR